MKRIPTQFLAKMTVAVFCLATVLAPARADDSLKTINNPGGGQIIYGPLLGGESSLPDAMVSMLRNVHARFGERPQIGKFFQARGSNSVATFFTVTAKTQGGKQIAGMVIVSMPSGSKPSGALLYDDADRFNMTANPMLKKLNEVWQGDVAHAVASRQSNGARHAKAPYSHCIPRNSPITAARLDYPRDGKLTALAPAV